MRNVFCYQFVLLSSVVANMEGSGEAESIDKREKMRFGEAPLKALS
jgi:hypothetical protein